MSRKDYNHSENDNDCIVTMMKAPESTLGSKFRVERSQEGEGSRTQDKSQADQTEL